MAEVLYRKLGPDDAGEVLTVPRAAFLAEGRAYANFDIPPLVETLDQVRRELADNTIVGAYLGPRLVGSLRLTVAGPVGWVSRIAVAPDQQGRGVGGGLLAAIEALLPTGVTRLQLAVGAKSAANIAMYGRRGYRSLDQTTDPAGVQMVVMGKDLAEGG